MLERSRTKMVVTLGPASGTPEVFDRFCELGISVARLNFSHGSMEQRKSFLNMIRASKTDIAPAIMGDLCGPKARLGPVVEGGVRVDPGDEFIIQREAVLGKAGVFSCNCPVLIDDVQPGQKLLIDDGMIRALVMDKQTDTIRCKVTTGGVILGNKGLNLPNTHLHIASITDKDWADIDWAIANQLDYLALSFVRSSEDVESVRAYLNSRDADIALVAKIEMPQAVEDIAAIANAADVILVARGDLGVEMELTAVPLLQKQVVRAAQDAGKPVIVATQMLQSMVEHPSPTRAEVSDVANAILDGADAVMLSGETATGRYPVAAVETLRQIAHRTEEYMDKNGIEWPPPRLLQMMHHQTAAIAHGAKLIARDMDARLVVVWSQAGGAARFLSKNRLSLPVIALSTEAASVRRMALYYGVVPLQTEIPAHFDDLPLLVDDLVLKRGWANSGDRVLIVAGAPLGTAGATNGLMVHAVGDRT